MPDLAQIDIDNLISVEKSLLGDIIWLKRYNNPRRDFFTINVLSIRDDKFVLESYYNRETRKISLTLRYRNIALVTLHKNFHTNPDGRRIGGWHKQKYREVEHRKIAIEVDHEFNDDMLKRDIVSQFMRENNIHLAGHTYQENVDRLY